MGASERLFHALHRFTPTNTARVIAIEGQLPVTRVREALAALQARHPILTACIASSGRPTLVPGRGPAIALHVIRRRDDEHFERVLEQLLNTPIAHAPGPLLEVHYLRAPDQGRAELLLVCDHIICDGVSLNALAAELLSLCAGAPDAPPRRALGPLDALLPRFSVRTQLAGFAVTLVRSLRMLLLRNVYERRRAGKTTRFVSKRMSRRATERLVARARAEHTTVTGALMAATLQALTELRVTSPRLALSLPVNLRPYLSEHAIESADLGNFTNVAYLEAPRAGALWPRARSLKQALMHATKPERLLAALVLTYRTGRLFVRASRPPLSHVLISNSGVVPFVSCSPSFRPVDFFSATSAAMLSADFGFFCNTLDGQLRINLVFLEEVVAPEVGLRMVERVAALLAALGDADAQEGS